MTVAEHTHDQSIIPIPRVIGNFWRQIDDAEDTGPLLYEVERYEILPDRSGETTIVVQESTGVIHRTLEHSLHPLGSYQIEWCGNPGYRIRPAIAECSAA